MKRLWRDLRFNAVQIMSRKKYLIKLFVSVLKNVQVVDFRPWFREAFLHGNLFGESGCMGLGDLKTVTFESENSVFELNESKPDQADLDLGPAPRNVYPVVFCCMPKEQEGKSH
jgi:hypothetical protein